MDTFISTSPTGVHLLLRPLIFRLVALSSCLEISKELYSSLFIQQSVAPLSRYNLFLIPFNFPCTEIKPGLFECDTANSQLFCSFDSALGTVFGSPCFFSPGFSWFCFLGLFIKAKPCVIQALKAAHFLSPQGCFFG